VQGASYSAVAGPPSNTAIRVDATSLTRAGVPVRNTTWQVAVMYEGKAAGSLQQGCAFTTTSLTVMHRHYRLVAEAIRVTTETVDEPFSGDGKYDEIFVASIAGILDRSSGSRARRPPSPERRSRWSRETRCGWAHRGEGRCYLENHNQDRPIGLEVNTSAPDPMGLVGDWRDELVILSSEKIEAAFVSGTNRIEVRFWDHWNLPSTPPTTVNYLNGDYTLVIRIERIP